MLFPSFILLCLMIIPCSTQNVIRYFPEIPIQCSSKIKCPEEWPCCSQFGQCGLGPHCIGGCNYRLSNNPGNCVPQPALLPSMVPSIMISSMQHEPALMTSFGSRVKPALGVEREPTEKGLHDRGIIHYTDFLISPKEEVIQQMLNDYHFTYSGFVGYDSFNTLILAMPKKTSGSLLSSTRSFLYGRSTVKMKTARGRGVVTAVVLISAVGDEIDFEFIGGELLTTQSNYYHQGELIHTRMEKLKLSSDSFENYHIYEIDWNQDRIHWIVNGEIRRTVYKSDTWNEKKQCYEYPQTPMRLQVSIWPAGLTDAHPGTIQWAGGLIDWENSPDILEKGQFYTTIESVTITPFENKYWPDMVRSLNSKGLAINRRNLINITYNYRDISNINESWDEDSVIWNDGVSSYLPSLDSDGLHARLVRTKIDKNIIIEKETGHANPSKSFIQDLKKFETGSDGRLHLKITTLSSNPTENLAANLLSRNPLQKLLNYIARQLN